MVESNIIILAAICIISLIVYMNTVDSWFISDDYVLIGQLAESGYFYSWNEVSGGFLRPIAVLSIMVDYQLWGFEPRGYHAFNLLLNVLCAFGVFILAGDLFRALHHARGRNTALFAGFLFLLLPSHGEPVVWISARADLMATFFAVFSTIVFLRMLESGSRWRGAFSVLLFALGLAAKESVVMLPLIWLILAVVYSKMKEKRFSRQGAIVISAGIAVLTVYFIIRRILLGSFIGGLGSDTHAGVLNPDVLVNLARYCFRVFIPPLNEIWTASISFSLLAALAVIVFWKKLYTKLMSKELRLSLISLSCFLTALLPVLSLKIGVYDTQSERYLYLPGVFACIALASLVREAIVDERSRKVFMVLLLAVSGLGLYTVNMRWSVAGDISQRISEQVSQFDPASSIIVNLPDHYRGVYVLRNGIDMASTVFQGSIRTEDPWTVLHYHGINSLSDRYSSGFMQDSVYLILSDSAYGFPLDQEFEYIFFDGAEIVVADRRF
jgi:hypothetical protein